MIYSIGKLVFFLILWFVVGIYLIPLFLKRARKLMSDETLLIVSLALCFGMVVLAARVGFSPAFGAFIMGSILAETVESEHIDKLVAPVKDLFGAIFFVSVGMMVDPNMIVEYIWPILQSRINDESIFYNHNNYHPPVMYEFRIIPDIFLNVINEFTGIMEYREYFCKLV